MAESETVQGGVEQNVVTASTMLSSARKTIGLSQKEVADQLYLTTAIIKQLDEGAFENFPKPAYIKGYLRIYARAVEISGDEVVARYEQALQAADESVAIGRVTEETVGSVAITGPVFQTGLVGLFGVLVVVAMVWWIVSSGNESEVHVPQVTEELKNGSAENSQAETGWSGFDSLSPDDQTGEVVGKIDEPSNSSGTAVTAVTNEVVANEGVTNVKKGDSAESDSTGVTFDASVEKNEELIANDIKIERYRDGGINYVNINANGFDEVEATFLDDCWLEVEDGNGESVYGDLNKAGDVLRIYGVSPFKLIIGRAAAINLTFNGDHIDLDRFTAADETALLTLTRQR